mmetsp:Transcript_70527/g.199078  ORF Transcript_70527/g.199078 Transcript_70527/m.199078 type:complete len:206 (-) Transcript_70527:109-726(-)
MPRPRWVPSMRAKPRPAAPGPPPLGIRSRHSGVSSTHSRSSASRILLKFTWIFWPRRTMHRLSASLWGAALTKTMLFSASYHSTGSCCACCACGACSAALAAGWAPSSGSFASASACGGGTAREVSCLGASSCKPLTRRCHRLDSPMFSSRLSPTACTSSAVSSFRSCSDSNPNSLIRRAVCGASPCLLNRVVNSASCCFLCSSS